MDSECNPFLSNDFHEEEKTAVEIDSKVEAMEQDLGQESMCQLRSDESELEAGGDEPDDNNKVCQEQLGENDLTSVYGSDVSNDGALSDEPDERSFPLSELYPYIRCALCNGFFIDATTITECLHTFCKSCIVKHFFYSNRCPNCNVVVHQTQPLYNIRLDRQLQDIVYKMVPHLEGTERGRLHDFYKERGLEVPKPATSPPAPVAKAQKQKKGPVPQSVFTIPSELDVSLMLEFVGAEEGIEKYKPLERKYVRVSGEATIRHVELFIRRKMELNPSCQVDVVCGDHLLDRYQSLREVRNFMGEGALQDGLLVLHFGLVQAPSV